MSFGEQYGIPIIAKRDDKFPVCRNGLPKRHVLLRGERSYIGQSSNLGVSILMQ